jgi:hypothetical protein
MNLWLPEPMNPYTPEAPEPKAKLPAWKVYFIGCLVGAFVGWFVTFLVMSAKTPEQVLQQERLAIEKQQQVIQAAIAALDVYSQMLTNGSLKAEKGQ